MLVFGLKDLMQLSAPIIYRGDLVYKTIMNKNIFGNYYLCSFFGKVSICAVLVILISVFSVDSNADMLIFTKGRVLHGEIIGETKNTITVDLMIGGKLIIPASAPIEVKKEAKIDYLIKKADYLVSRKKDANAISIYLRGLEYSPNNQLIMKKIEELRSRRVSEDLEEKIAFGDKLVDEGEYRAAIAFYNSLLQHEASPKVTRDILRKISNTHALMAYIYYNHCFEEWAMQEINKAEEYDPNVPMIYYVLGRIHQDQQKYNLAEQDFRRSLQIDPLFRDAESRLTELRKFTY